MSMFKKPKRQFRQRTHHSDDDDEDKGNGGDIELPSTREVQMSRPSIKTTNSIIMNLSDEDEVDNELYSDKTGKEKKTGMKLSFHDDDENEGDVFKVKKSSYSRKISRQHEKEKKKKTKDTNKVRQDMPIKIKPDLDMVKKEADDNGELNVIWIKSETVKPKVEPEPDLKDEAVPGDTLDNDDEDMENEDEKDPFYHKFQGVLERGVIPDAKTIYALKKQRQLARDATEFIPLDNDVKHEDNSHSRLIRDDNDDNEECDDDDDDDDERMAFAVNKEAIEREKAREALIQAQEEAEVIGMKDGGDSEDEIERWEQEQIKKGVGVQNQAQLLAQTHIGNQYMNQFDSDGLQLNPSVANKNWKPKSTIPSHLLKNKQINQITPDTIRDRIMDRLSKLTESLESHERQITYINIESKQLQETITNLEKELQNTSPSLTQEINSYSNNDHQ